MAALLFARRAPGPACALGRPRPRPPRPRPVPPPPRPELEAAVRAIAADRALSGATVGVEILDVDSSTACSRRSTSTRRSIRRPTRSFIRRSGGGPRGSSRRSPVRDRALGQARRRRGGRPARAAWLRDPSLSTADLSAMVQRAQAVRRQARGRRHGRPALLRRGDDAARVRPAAQRVGIVPGARERGRARRELRDDDRAPVVAWRSRPGRVRAARVRRRGRRRADERVGGRRHGRARAGRER